MGKIVCVGSAITDLTGYASHLPTAGETATGEQFRIGPGGKGSNQVTAAHRAGADVVFISAVGDDPLADVLHAHYRSCGIDERYVRVVKGESTATAMVQIETGTAQNRILIIPSVLLSISAADVCAAEKEFADADLVLVQFETSLESILEAKRLAKKYGKPFVVNPAPYRAMPEGFYEGVDYVTPNETEAEYLAGVPVCDLDSANAAAQKLLAMGAKHAIITLGKNGVFYADGTKTLHIAGLKMKAVDTTGAGDSFHGGLLTALSEGLPIETALAFANCTGALSVTRMGAATSCPSREEIVALLQSAYGISLT